MKKGKRHLEEMAYGRNRTGQGSNWRLDPIISTEKYAQSRGNPALGKVTRIRSRSPRFDWEGAVGETNGKGIKMRIRTALPAIP